MKNSAQKETEKKNQNRDQVVIQKSEIYFSKKRQSQKSENVI
jgi:hypothetical protein